ncbi:MAG: hypothetical protein Nkreftii_003851 [Candidatus Nitrospira kreftii]|uniref:Uncharacterized protein n=1 Tax=Candidatus Nitrospira kreftii TaxID=2652173 RepID=A0A7S8J0C0_9BACT|nr:MAG: hypothetical protein Nkreftii_003851 [Candidatus Nitrospira kreftii]
MKINALRHAHRNGKRVAARLSATLGVSVLVTVLSMICGYAPSAQALDPIPMHIMNGLQAGVVTSVESRSLFINGKEYLVDPDVEIRDQEDNVFPPEVVKRDQEVKFHLKKGAGNTIDFLIVYLPQ